jgi:hypothetical protein
MYKAYGKCVTTKSRVARKHMRRDVFIFNKKIAKARKKAARLERKSLAEGQGE